MPRRALLSYTGDRTGVPSVADEAVMSTAALYDEPIVRAGPRTPGTASYMHARRPPYDGYEAANGMVPFRTDRMLESTPAEVLSSQAGRRVRHSTVPASLSSRPRKAGARGQLTAQLAAQLTVCCAGTSAVRPGAQH